MSSHTVFDSLYNSAEEEKGVKQLSYDDFKKLRESGEEVLLLDVLSHESFFEGHIEGAISFPVNKINEETAREKLPENAKIVVYCAGYSCTASTKAGRVLERLGYKVLDYKGGIEKWQEEGNELASGD